METKLVRMGAVVLSGIALVLAVLAFAPGWDVYANANAVWAGVLDHTEAATDWRVAIGCALFALAGLGVAKRPHAWLGFAWIAATVITVVAIAIATFELTLFDDTLRYARWGGEITDVLFPIGVIAMLVYSVLCVGLAVAAVLRKRPAAEAVAVG
jgi:hypothetical protein